MTPEALAALAARAYRHMPAWSAAQFEGTLASRFALLVAGDHGFVLGQVIADEAEILALATAPEAQRHGVASDLLARFVEQARARGAARVFLEVAADNAPAIALYRRHGFAQTGHRKAYYRRADGTSGDALLMSRALP